MPDEPTLSVVVPTLDEAGNLPRLLERLDQALAERSYEVIVVDDGSTDGTRAAARRFEGPVHVVHRPDGDGLASAAVRGIELARGEHVCVMDGDLQHPPEAVPDLLGAAEWRGADLVVGSRYTGTGQAPSFAWHRRLISRGARSLILALLPTTRRAGLTDPTSGLFLFQRDRVDPAALDPSGYKILLEVLERGRFEQIEEVGFTFGDRQAGDSNLTPQAAWSTLSHLVGLALEDEDNRRLAAFGAVGAIGVIVNLALLALLTEGVGLHYIVSAGVAIEASILSNFALNDAWTFRDMRQGAWWSRLWRFNLVSGLALLVNLAVLSFLTEVVGVFYLVSEVVAIGVAFATNYRGNVGWTYVAVGEDAARGDARRTWEKITARPRKLVAQVREKLWPGHVNAPKDDEMP